MPAMLFNLYFVLRVLTVLLYIGTSIDCVYGAGGTDSGRW